MYWLVGATYLVAVLITVIHSRQNRPYRRRSLAAESRPAFLHATWDTHLRVTGEVNLPAQRVALGFILAGLLMGTASAAVLAVPVYDLVTALIEGSFSWEPLAVPVRGVLPA
ncbi:hypothetical protein HGQ17_10685 [Nesterenkonia sp. MY13]|uniref:Uncharacterized protein n=1 Tax=Nesterenkonia sedimenti TaxID=1463632 RepID=A0A7X8TKG8_9MICC|nr:hypothetical protein [Nesterenkonia sedimenti]NLS10446.1 hypothetical protein [Nesterenkonia sedimenti]